MISYIKDKMAMAAEFISIMNKQQFEEPKPPYQKRTDDKAPCCSLGTSNY